MPIASGAAGRVDVGVDTSLTWTPEGLKRRNKPLTKSHDSYLQRYQELKQRQNKHKLLQKHSSDVNIHEIDGDTTEENKEQNVCSEDQTSGTPSRKERSKKSALCVLL